MSDVAIIGGGMAGLAVARALRSAGRDCEIFEATDRVGGSVASERIDRITVDRGFQVLNSWYPAVKEALSPAEYAGLKLSPFKPAIQTLTPKGLALIVDPIRAPHLLPALVRSRIASAISLWDSFYLQGWLQSELIHRSSLERRTVRPRRRAKDITVAASLDRSGVTGALRKLAVDPMLRAFLWDTDGESSAQFAKWLFVTLTRGALTLPANGMGELAETMGRIPGVDIHLQTPVEGVRVVGSGADAGVHISAGGRTQRFDYAIMALPQAVEARLLSTPVRPTRGVSTWWFLADDKLKEMPYITVDGSGRTPLALAAEVTSVAPGYAPGRRLVAATVVHPRPTAAQPQSPQPGALWSGTAAASRLELPTDPQVQRFLGTLWGVDTSGWEVLTRHDIPDAAVLVSPGEAMRTPEELELREGRLALAGTHHATPTIDGAMRSGQRAAKQVLAQMEA